MIKNKQKEGALKFVLAVTGASGSIYAKTILDTLVKEQSQLERVDIIFSNEAISVWNHELSGLEYNSYPFNYYDRADFFAPCASGSNQYDAMIVCPCTMGTLGRLANGISSDLITRTADVMLKEQQKLILVARESPYSAIHLKNMLSLTQAGALILPASPSFYSLPQTTEAIIKTVTDRVLIKAGLNLDFKGWSEGE